MQLRECVLCLGLMLAAGGCAKVKAAVCGEPVVIKAPGVGDPKSGKPAAEAASPEPLAQDAPTLARTTKPEPELQERFALPFAWEKSPTEPLSRTRAFLRDVVRDNNLYMQRGPAFFKAFANQETPRATVVACADSRVQAGAWDASPENDDFTIRNLANQVDNGLGSIEYGVDQLQTPLLVVLGHTGCSAIAAAVSGDARMSDAIQRELSTLKLTKHKGKKAATDAALRDAVLKNVHDQVETALTTFASRVNAGQLTVVGAVYDLRNELGKGPGKVTIINVNGVQGADRLKAFEDAVMAGAPAAGGKKSPDPFERLSQVFATHMHEQGDDEGEEDGDAHSQVIPLGPAPARPAGPGAGTMPASAAKPH